MPTTRSAARKADSTSSGSSKAVAGNKRKAETSPSTSPASKPKKSQAPKKQKTIEETLQDQPNDDQKDDKEVSKDVEMKDATAADHSNSEDVPKASEAGNNDSKTSNSTMNEKPMEKTDGAGQDAVQTQTGDEKKNQQANATTEYKPDSKVMPTSTSEDITIKTNGDHASEKPSLDASIGNDVEKTGGSPHKTNGFAQPAKKEETINSQETAKAFDANDIKPTQDTAVNQSSEREMSTPSSILEKGIIYFFFRGRVGIDEPSEVDDLARSYIVLHPLPRGAKLSDGPLGDAKNLRVLALPKKVLPKGPNDRFMVFVEKSKANLEDLKKEFLSASDYDTKTAGPRHTPAATPIGEGVYAITSTGRESHLAYILTIPQELSEVQKDIGLEAKGSWVTSVKNPQHKGPAQAQLPKDPEFPQE